MNRLLFVMCCFFVGMQVQCVPGESPPDASTAEAPVPEWAKEAVWYQIFVERFRNGDPSNDPTLHDIEGSWPHAQPDGWQPTPWTHDWYEQEAWAEATGEPFYYTVQLRRYGGDLQGVIDQLDYLQDLGVTALYLNPINDAPSLHKYDARAYRHVDRTFGPDPRGDEAIMAQETPDDPSTWQWTAADRLFLHLVEEMHRRGMRIILDYSWNHTGITFWAWRHVLEHQQASPYADWYQIKQFDDPDTPENEFDYEGWAGVRELPNLTKVGVPEGYHGGPAEGNLHPAVKQHVFAVTRRWLDPDGDGDPSDGIDGFRLDVAEMVPLGFWRDYRRYVKAINPEAYLVGETWWEKWPDKMMDPRPYLGDVFDAVMNYRWYMPTRSYFADALPRETASSYVAHLDSVEAGIAQDHLHAMMNLTATHDSPRLATSIYNPGRYKAGVNPRDNPAYKVEKPDARTRAVQRLILVQQFTYYGAPHIWSGDELGMWGADDPDNRKPVVWPDLVYEDERTHPLGTSRRVDSVVPDTTLFHFYQQLIAMRKQHIDLFRSGDLAYVLTDDERGVLVYTRTLARKQAVVAFNKSGRVQVVSIPVEATRAYESLLETGPGYEVSEGHLTFELGPMKAVVLMRE
ncbi:MAG: glycoside hydrolase family 13 protein [Rhodothermales bacterium]